MTAWQALHTLEQMGYRFERTDDGGVRGFIRGEPPAEAAALLDVARRDRESAVAYVREREAGATVDGFTLSVPDALAVALAVRMGEARLLGAVIYHQRENNVTVRWEPMGDLSRYRERLKTDLQGRIKAMDAAPYWNMGAEEYDAMCVKYGAYCRVLEELD